MRAPDILIFLPIFRELSQDISDLFRNDVSVKIYGRLMADSAVRIIFTLLFLLLQILFLNPQKEVPFAHPMPGRPGIRVVKIWIAGGGLIPGPDQAPREIFCIIAT
jgi:hypothetical protein